MRHFLVCYAAFFIYNIGLSQDKSKDILFVGNSLTYYNNMPLTLQQMLDAADENFNVYQSTFPGILLNEHVKLNQNPKNRIIRASDRARDTSNSNILFIGQKHWDFVVLQEVTTTILIPETYEKLYIPAVTSLDSLVKLAGAKTVLFQPYTLGIYPMEYRYTSEKGGALFLSPRFENSLDEFFYCEKQVKRMAKSIGADIVPIGSAFEDCRIRFPDISLLVDMYDSHPNENGSYLIACLFFRYFTGKKCTSIGYNANLDKKVEKKLQRVADRVKMN